MILPVQGECGLSPTATTISFGQRLRAWRQRRRLSQLDLAVDAQISTRHLSYVENGRANPSREMVLRLTSKLQVPLRERNAFLIAAGYAPMYGERRLADPALVAAKQAVELILRSHEPFPALAIDRHWNLVAANRIVPHLLAEVDESLLQPPMNVLRLTLHPLGLAPNIINLAQWRAHLLERLGHQIAATADPALIALLADLQKLPPPESAAAEHLYGEHMGIAVPLKFRSPSGVLSFISTTTIFGSPTDVTLQELALETFFPLDEPTRSTLLSGISPTSQAPVSALTSGLI
jgi:transcriptional regulator with XRE-family HTH domain